jgi:hypothetical protein
MRTAFGQPQERRVLIFAMSAYPRSSASETTTASGRSAFTRSGTPLPHCSKTSECPPGTRRPSSGTRISRPLSRSTSAWTNQPPRGLDEAQQAPRGARNEPLLWSTLVVNRRFHDLARIVSQVELGGLEPGPLPAIWAQDVGNSRSPGAAATSPSAEIGLAGSSCGQAWRSTGGGSWFSSHCSVSVIIFQGAGQDQYHEGVRQVSGRFVRVVSGPPMGWIDGRASACTLAPYRVAGASWYAWCAVMPCWQAGLEVPPYMRVAENRPGRDS